MINYSGYIYLWFDTKAKLFYLGGHKGKVEDSYICSNTMVLRAYKKRPHTFKFRVLEYVVGDNKDIRAAEQRWLDMIEDSQLYWTPNIYNKTVKYYNQKKFAAGGNGRANLGNSNIGGHNKGQKGIHNHTPETRSRMSELKKQYWARKKMADSVSTLCRAHMN